MQSESQEAPPAAALSARSKYRVRFEKAGDLRLVSHHDLMHCFQRMLRRAALPVPSTQGFNPRPRLWFAQSLALGVIGRNEVLELELTDPLPTEEVQRRLAGQCAPGLAIHAVKAIDAKASARVRRAFYRLPLGWHALSPRRACETSNPRPSQTQGVPPEIADLPARYAAFLASEHHWIERTRPHHRRLDIRPYVAALSWTTDALEMALWITPHGAARPDEVAAALGLEPLLESGAVLERTDLELTDETTDTTPLPAGLPQRPLETEEANDRRDEPAAAGRPTALMSGPLSFDS